MLDGARNEGAIILEKKLEAANRFVEAIKPDLWEGAADVSVGELVKYEGMQDAEAAREWLKMDEIKGFMEGVKEGTVSWEGEQPLEIAPETLVP